MAGVELQEVRLGWGRGGGAEPGTGWQQWIQPYPQVARPECSQQGGDCCGCTWGLRRGGSLQEANTGAGPQCPGKAVKWEGHTQGGRSTCGEGEGRGEGQGANLEMTGFGWRVTCKCRQWEGGEGRVAPLAPKVKRH